VDFSVPHTDIDDGVMYTCSEGVRASDAEDDI
jgi:hypothetical protein